MCEAIRSRNCDSGGCLSENSLLKWDPQDYAQHSGGQLDWARELIARLHLRGAESVLDVGCGDAKATAEIARAVPRGHVLGVDNNPEFIAFASTQFPASEFPHLEFRRMDARWLAAERRFDVVFSNAALHWVDDHPAFLRGARRLLNGASAPAVSDRTTSSKP